jgi:flagellar biosynthesis protein FlhF
MPQPTSHSAGSFFKFTVGSAEEAARVIREQIGGEARVLSVRNVETGGLRGLFSPPKLEVIAQIAPVEAPPPEPSVPSPTTVEQNTVETRVAGAGARVTMRRSRTELASAENLLPVLQRAGLSAALLARLEQQPGWNGIRALPLHRALVETGALLRAGVRERAENARLTRAAFLGTAGSGRTTALCKWLAVEIFRHARLGHVVTAEFDRPNHPGPLPVYCEALGVPCARFPAATQPAAPGGFVYFDLPSISLRPGSDNAALERFLDAERITERVLVLNAAYGRAALRAACAAGRDLGATHLVLTHLDEAGQWGRLWDFLLDGDLIPLFLASGPSLNGEIETDVGDAIARRTLPLPAPEDEAAPSGRGASSGLAENLNAAA